MDVYIDKIKEIVSPFVEQGGFELVDLHIRRDKKRVILKFLIDRLNGGISLDECTKLNEEIGEVLDKEAVIQDSFILEVSSPGLDRPLMTINDFKRAKGKDVRVFLREPIRDKIEFAGKINSVSENCVSINTGDQEIEISIDKINKAKQIF